MEKLRWCYLKSYGIDSSGTDPEISSIQDQFIKENGKLVKTSKKLGGPYTKSERFKRKQEVYRLHFELSIPAIQIAEMMNVNYNTIRSDIQFWWDRLSNEWTYHDIGSLAMRQMNRLEIQRARLLEYLKEEKNIQSKLPIEKQIFDIDIKINQYYTNTTHIEKVMMDGAVKVLNDLAADKKWGQLFMRGRELIGIAEEDHDKIWKMIQESKSKVRTRELSRM